MKTRDFGDSEYGVFKVIEFIYIYGYLLCFYAHIQTLMNQEPLALRLWNFDRIIHYPWTTVTQIFNVVASLVLEILAFILNSVDG